MEKLNRMKGAVKGTITKLENFIKDISEDSSYTSIQIEVKIRKLKELESKVTEIRESFYEIQEIKDLPAIETELDELDDRLENIEVSLNSLLKPLKVVPDTKQIENSDIKNLNIKVKLPEIPLPLFTGRYDEWPTFKAQFTNLIVNNEQLNDVQKLYYLRASLHAEAKQLESADDSFDSLFTALKERFENHRLLVDTHLLSIINYEKIQHESSKDLRNFIDCINRNLRALKVLNYEQNNLSDAFLINIILQKLDKETRKLFEYTSKKSEYPQFAELMSFLENRSSTLESVNRNSAIKQSNKNIPFSNKTKTFMLNSKEKSKQKSCVLCKGLHNLNKCSHFLNMTVSERYDFVKQNKLCINCLNNNHSVKLCSSKFSCVHCQKRHSSLLHRDKKEKSENEHSSQLSADDTLSAKTHATLPANEETAPIKTEGFHTLSNVMKEKQSILLSTCFIYIHDHYGNRYRIRAILDSASNINILLDNCVEMLRLKREIINVPVTGLGGYTHNIKNKISTVISNKDETFKENLDFLIVPKITDVIPTTQLNVSNIELPPFTELADPTFFKPGKIHALIGAELYYRILKHNSYKINDKLHLQNSVFGWIPTGALEELKPSNNYGQCHFISEFKEVNDSLKKFWELEAIGIKHDDYKISEEDQAQNIFDKTVKFINGRYEIELPWKRDWRELKDNFNIAKQRLEGLQRKFFRNPELYHQYSEIIHDYFNKGIIEQVEGHELIKNKPVYYLPHHAVCKEDKLTTKVRIVFDASSHDTNEFSLNDCLWPGKNLNPLLFDILVQFRLHEIAFSSDIEKAFLQISLSEKDRDAVRFLWFNNDFRSLSNLKIFRFKRVLFGVNVSPFLLSATIKQHIKQYTTEYPTTVQLLDQYIYVDDFISGGDTVEEVLEVSRNASKIMSEAGMILRKWITNDGALMKCWQREGFSTQMEHATISLGSNLTKVLGMAWQTEEDCLTLEVKSLLEFVSSHKSSKRVLLQAVGKIFDPLGMLTPFTVRIKCLFQELWVKKIPWDGQLPPDVQKQWIKWCDELPDLANVKIPRKILSCANQEIVVELHAFSDASKLAYGSAVYLRVKSEKGIEVNLVASKSRVAPIKEITLPRLELLGALLSARLTKLIKEILDKKVTSTIYYWTDSKISLYWIKGSTKRWKQFVANRVTEIKTLSDTNCWYHCSSKDNPADLLTRGASVKTIVENSMWFKGPNFLIADNLPITNEPVDVPETDYLPETKTKYKDSNMDSLKNIDTNISLSLYRDSEAADLFLITNNYSNLLRIVAYIYRFFNNCRSGSSSRIQGCLTTPELKSAEIGLIRLVQNLEFKEEIKGLEKESKVPPSSKIKCLSPFLDQHKIIRVGGRLENCSINFDSKHPILLPSKSKLTHLIISYYHNKYFHSGPQNLLYQIRQKYWPLNGRNLCRKIVHNCIPCFKANPKPCYQKMGDLPKQRVNRDFVFNSVGIDICGPFFIKNRKQRKGSLTKIYVCIFICLVTKAVHLEILSDLTSESTIATLKRFIGRRGKCSKIFSDNGTNFVGANRELQGLFKLIRNQTEGIMRFLSEENIEWEFIPPRAPNFGGLWEAGVKSFKYYLRRTVSHSNLTYEEFLTVMIQIESMLNSRPLTPLTSDIEDLEILTPAHFLIGRPLTAIPEPLLLDVATNRLSLWQKTTKLVQIIWKQWSLSYLNNLQQRNKWMFQRENVKIGDMVLIRDDTLPVNKWRLGRIVKTYPGKDNMIRVADVKTQTGIYKRAVSKLSVLPLETQS